MRSRQLLFVVLACLVVPLLASCSVSGGVSSVKHAASKAESSYHSYSAKNSSTSSSGRGAPAGSRASGTVPGGPTHGGVLAYSSASEKVVQSQPAAGSCHAIGSGLYVEPDPRCTPGALNPQVTQATIDQTICQTGWTKTIRPSSSVTEREKAASMSAYGDSGSLHYFEYDHLVSLELGGAVNAPANLWPEPGTVPNPKDKVENALNALVCERKITLSSAQHIISEQWVPYYHAHY